MAKFVCLLVCLGVLSLSALSNGLSCYNCNSDKEGGCLKSTNPKTLVCGNAAAGFKSHCYYVHTVDKDHKVSVNASCGTIAANLPLVKTNMPMCLMPNTEVKECKLCESDLCNSASFLSSHYLSFLYLPILYFVTKVLVH